MTSSTYERVWLPHTHALAEGRRPVMHGSRLRVCVGKHRLVLWRYLDGQPAPCHWCGRDLVWRNQPGGVDTLVPDHLDGDKRNNDPANLVPACHGCNTSRARTLALDVADAQALRDEGHSYRVIARRLGVSVSTVHYHLVGRPGG